MGTIEPESPVSSHEDEGVDGDVGGDVDDVLDCPAPGQTEGPEHQDVVTRRGRDTDLASDDINTLTLSCRLPLLPVKTEDLPRPSSV